MDNGRCLDSWMDLLFCSFTRRSLSSSLCSRDFDTIVVLFVLGGIVKVGWMEYLKVHAIA